jgi:hypothetical protein
LRCDVTRYAIVLHSLATHDARIQLVRFENPLFNDSDVQVKSEDGTCVEGAAKWDQSGVAGKDDMVSWHLPRRALDNTAFQITDPIGKFSFVMDHLSVSALRMAVCLYAIFLGSPSVDASTSMLLPKVAVACCKHRSLQTRLC